jgi:hypothetical protein
MLRCAQQAAKQQDIHSSRENVKYHKAHKQSYHIEEAVREA